MMEFSGLLICHEFGISIDSRQEKLTMAILGECM